jgi:hypothetical protein
MTPVKGGLRDGQPEPSATLGHPKLELVRSENADVSAQVAEFVDDVQERQCATGSLCECERTLVSDDAVWRKVDRTQNVSERQLLEPLHRQQWHDQRRTRRISRDHFSDPSEPITGGRSQRRTDDDQVRTHAPRVVDDGGRGIAFTHDGRGALANHG